MMLYNSNWLKFRRDVGSEQMLITLLMIYKAH